MSWCSDVGREGTASRLGFCSSFCHEAEPRAGPASGPPALMPGGHRGGAPMGAARRLCGKQAGARQGQSCSASVRPGRSSPMPPTQLGRMLFTVDGWGWIFTRALSCVQARRPLRRPISMGLARLDSTSAGAARGLALRRSSIWGIHAVLRLRRRAPDQRRRREESIARSRNRSSMEPHLPQHRGAAERRPRLRRTVQCPVARREEGGYLSPAQARQAPGPRDVTQARRDESCGQTCVQGTGCDTVGIGWASPFHLISPGRTRVRPSLLWRICG